MFRTLVAIVCLLALGLPVLAQDEADAEQAKRIEELIEQLGSENKSVRCVAALALGEIGPNAATAVPALIAAMSDEDKYADVRGFAAQALVVHQD